jgi:cytochrome c oxidase subunit 2
MRLHPVYALGALASASALAGCAGEQSVLYPAGPNAAHLADLFWMFTAVCTTIWLLVAVALAGALLRRRRNASMEVSLLSDPAGERRAGMVVAGATAATVVIISALTVLSYFATHALSQPRADALVIKVTGYQWWWNFEYQNSDPTQVFAAANEMHIPVGRTVSLHLAAADVIHSYWVPNLTGKQDLIPGRGNQLTFVADRPGIWRGQCAEFCGLQHAHMAFTVTVEPPAKFEIWRQQQLKPAAMPADPESQAGQQVFMTKGCSLCHSIQGTDAGGRTAPDLTHVGSRPTIAAGTLPNTRGSLAAWIADPQHVKPGNNMPQIPLGPAELNAVAAYLAGLT